MAESLLFYINYLNSIKLHFLHPVPVNIGTVVLTIVLPRNDGSDPGFPISSHDTVLYLHLQCNLYIMRRIYLVKSHHLLIICYVVDLSRHTWHERDLASVVLSLRLCAKLNISHPTSKRLPGIPLGTSDFR